MVKNKSFKGWAGSRAGLWMSDHGHGHGGGGGGGHGGFGGGGLELATTTTLKRIINNFKSALNLKKK